MKTIYKYPIPVEDAFTLELPTNVNILHISTQNNKPYMWCLIDTEDKVSPRLFRLYGTGHEIIQPKTGTYVFLGSFEMFQAAYVWHLFEWVGYSQ